MTASPTAPSGAAGPSAVVWEVVLPDGQVVLAVRSESSPFRFYAVLPGPDGRWTCGCPGYRYRGDCRHVRGLSRQHAPVAQVTREALST